MSCGALDEGTCQLGASSSLEHYYDMELTRSSIMTLSATSEWSKQQTMLTEHDVRSLHKLMMQRSAPEIAGDMLT
jgi:hypothetical protein